MIPFLSARIKGLRKVVSDWEDRTEEWKIDLWGYFIIPALLFAFVALITAPFWLSSS